MSSVSVAVGTFNGRRFLEEQLDSILEQTLAPMEIIVSDDGSDDGTLAMVEHRARSSPIPIRLLQAEGHLGVTGNFERALVAASGDFVALSDQDDVWHPEHLSRLADMLTSNEQLLLVHSDARLVDADGIPSGASLFQALRVRDREIEQVRNGRAFDVLVHRNLVTGATAMVRRSLIDRAAPFARSWVHDEWLAIVAASSGGVGIVVDSLVDYRQHGANEIGARRLTVGELLRRVVAPAGERQAVLAQKWTELATRASDLGFDPSQRRVLDQKAEFERSRTADPRSRIRRIPRIAARAVRGGYGRFASQGLIDAVRDLLSSPSGPPAKPSAS